MWTTDENNFVGNAYQSAVTPPKDSVAAKNASVAENLALN